MQTTRFVVFQLANFLLFFFSGKCLIEKIPTGKAILEKGAIPTVFNNYPSYLIKKSPKKRKSPTKRAPPQNAKRKKRNLLEELIPEDQPNNSNCGALLEQTPIETQEPQSELTFATADNVKLPNDQWSVMKFSACLSFNHGVFDESTCQVSIDKTVLFYNNELSTPVVNVKNVKLKKDVRVFTLAEVESFLEEVEKITLCSGTGRKDKALSVDCEGIAPQSRPHRCSNCAKEKKTLEVRELRAKKIKHIKDTRRSRLSKTVKNLRRARKNLVKKVILTSAVSKNIGNHFYV